MNATASDFEKLGAFYLGRYSDSQAGTGDGVLLYDAKDLTTHAVCVGMTGSGKTGLCVTLLEEAALDGIPAVVIDPKGDLTNLLLTFPALRPEDFEPWVDEDDARRRGISRDELAEQQAELWRRGLAAWGQDGERIRRLRRSADFAIYTPGSTAGIPVSILSSFAAPSREIVDDAELLAERVATTASSLLGLLDIDADPIRSREHILLSTILAEAWKQDQDLDLAALIRAVQEPPVARVGALELEAFYPSADRFELAMLLNNLLAAPGFRTWLEGAPLDIGRFLYSPDGKPRVSIFTISHLSDAERMFFVSLLLNEVLGWMRGQTGTTSLRALLYMDEIFGFFPPVKEPPSKAPLLTMLKQGRAFGLGVVLATQNPVDLDYRGLSNAGTWLIGRLQTERDKARLLEGLEGAAAGGAELDRRAMEQVIAGLGKRVFLLNNVHEPGPVIFETRWVMSYLRGPLARPGIERLMDRRREELLAAGETARIVDQDTAAAAHAEAPVPPPGIECYFLPVQRAAPGGAALSYRPAIVAAANILYDDRRSGLRHTERPTLLCRLGKGAVPVDWTSATEVALAPRELEKEPSRQGRFAPLPRAASERKRYTVWKRDLGEWLYRNRTCELYESRLLGERSEPGESELEFRVRMRQVARERRDEAVAQLRQKYEPKIARLEERVRRVQERLERETEQARHEKLQTAISLGATLVAAMIGRKSMSRSTVGRATTTARGIGRSLRDAQDVDRAREMLERHREELTALEAELEDEAQAIRASYDPMVEDLETVSVRPKKKNIQVVLLALAWVPYWQRTGSEELVPAWRGSAPGDR